MNISKAFLVLVLAGHCIAVEPYGAASGVPENGASAKQPEHMPSLSGDKTDSPEMVLLARARESSAALYSNLQSFVCNERMDRFITSPGADRQIDTLRTKLSFENGVEQYDAIYQDDRKRPSISSVAGAWSEGEFGTLLRQTQSLLNDRPVGFVANLDLNGTPAALFEVEVSAQDSPWELEIEQSHYKVPFRTEVWVSRETAEILKLERISGPLNKVGIAEIRWGVVLGAVDLNGRTWRLPASGDYSVTYHKANRCEWNRMSFADYRRYGSEAELRF